MYFKKKIFFLVIIFFSISSISFSEIVKDIKVKGNERVSDKSIEMFSNINIGDDVDQDQLNQILKNVYDSNFFKDVKVSLKDNILTIFVEESSLVENVTIKGPKSKTLISDLKKNLRVKSRTSYNEILFLEDKKNITEALKQKGYFFSKVDVMIEELSDNKINLIYNVEIGDKAKIKKISFIGDKIFKDRKLRSVIVSEEYKFWKFISGKKFLNQNLINLDERLLKNFYLNKGFYNVKINSSFARMLNETEFELIYNIIPNKRIFFNKISLDLPIDFDQTNFNNLNKLFKNLKGEKYSLFVIEKILKEIDKIILDEEYKTLKTEVSENIFDNKIDLTFSINEGKKFIVERINIYGNNITQENVIRNQLLIDEGDEFNSILASKSINNIQSLNIFKSVDSKIIDNENNSKTIDITIEEKATGEIMAGAGFGTDGSSLSFAVKENNYLGRGIKLVSELSVSEETIKGQFNVKNPNFKNSDKSIDFNIQSLETDKLTDSGYKTNKTGFGFGTSFEYQDDVFIGLGQDSYYEKIETNSSASTRQKSQSGNYWDTFLNLNLNYDKRNQKYRTTDGFLSSYSVNLPVISENNSLTNAYIFTLYDELYEDNVTKFSFFAKAANSLTNDNIKLSERIYLPGSRLRGFVSGGVGPKDGNDFIGGNYATSVNIQTSIPQLLPNIQNMDVSMFLDAGNVWGVDYDSSLNDTNKIRSSIGIGIDWFTLIGPLSASFTHPISKVNTDKTETFKFNLGTTF
jgi:outer membrane protein insertion porin family